MWNKPKLISSRDITTELNIIAQEQTKSKLINSVEESLELANISLEKGNLTHSLHVLDRGIEANPDNPRLITARAKVYILMKAWEYALEQVDYLLYLNPDNEDAKGAKELLQKTIEYHKLVTSYPLYS